MKLAIRSTLLGSLALSFVFSTATPAVFADEKPAKPAANQQTIDAKQKFEDLEIKKGIQQGNLTDKERSKVDKKQEDIAKREARYAGSGGKLTKFEAREINRMQNNAQKQIVKEGTDDQTKASEKLKAEQKKNK